MLENKLSRVGGVGGGGGGVLDQMKIRLTQPSFTETRAWAELGNTNLKKCKVFKTVYFPKSCTSFGSIYFSCNVSIQNIMYMCFQSMCLLTLRKLKVILTFHKR